MWPAPNDVAGCPLASAIALPFMHASVVAGRPLICTAHVVGRARTLTCEPSLVSLLAPCSFIQAHGSALLCPGPQRNGGLNSLWTSAQEVTNDGELLLRLLANTSNKFESLRCWFTACRLRYQWLGRPCRRCPAAVRAAALTPGLPTLPAPPACLPACLHA